MSLQSLVLRSHPEVASRRKHDRIHYTKRADWDFYSSANGAKEGYLEDISEGGCLLRTSEPIEHRRWLRLIARDGRNGLFFSAVGRVVRREDRMEFLEFEGEQSAVTLHRYGVEFVHPVNSMLLALISRI